MVLAPFGNVFPAAAKWTIPFARVSEYFWSIALDGTSIPKLEFVMRAPMDSDQARESTSQWTSNEKRPLQSAFEMAKRADADLTPGAIPTIPRWLLIFPETNPATDV